MDTNSMIPAQLRVLLDDAKYWIANNTFNPDELSIHFSHKLVAIHCFSNGNGRLSRLIADIVIEKLYKLPIYSWGASSLVIQGDQRSNYLSAIRTADKGDINL